MHRSVLQNGAYIRYANQNTIEVISMEELEKALQMGHSAVKTVEHVDAYGDKSDVLVEFPGLTLDDLDGTSNGKPIEFMDGNRIPYTAIVDPHTQKLMEGIKGKINGKQLIAKITPHAEALKKKHGPGVDRKLWNRAGQVEIQLDLHLGRGEFDKAVKAYTGFVAAIKKHDADEPHVLKSRRETMLESVTTDLGKRIDELSGLVSRASTKNEKRKAQKDAKRLARIARQLGNEELAAKAEDLAKA